MNLLITLRIALRALSKNKMRAGLTVLGVVIGIAAVTAMVSVGQSASALMQGQLDSLGTNVVIVMPAHSHRGGVQQGSTVTLTADDAQAISEECDTVRSASPIVGFSAQCIYGNANWRPGDLYGVGEEYLEVRDWDLKSGGFFTDRDIVSAAKVCVIGHTLVAKLFQTTNPLGEQIRINNIPMEVIGVLVEKGANFVGEDQDDIVLVPVTTMQKRLYGSQFKTYTPSWPRPKPTGSSTMQRMISDSCCLNDTASGPTKRPTFTCGT